MATIAFDTLKAKETLTRFGFQEKEATGVVTMTRDAVSESVATKEDIADLEVKIDRLKIGLVLGLFATVGIMFVALGFLIN